MVMKKLALYFNIYRKLQTLFHLKDSLIWIHKVVDFICELQGKWL